MATEDELKEQTGTLESLMKWHEGYGINNAQLKTKLYILKQKLRELRQERIRK